MCVILLVWSKPTTAFLITVIIVIIILTLGAGGKIGVVGCGWRESGGQGESVVGYGPVRVRIL